MNDLPNGFESKSLFERAAAAKMNTNIRDKVDAESIVIYLLAVAFIFVLAIPLVAYFIWSFAFVAVQLWNWFIIPFFHVGPVTVLQMAGIGCFVRLFTFSLSNTSIDTDKPWSQIAAELVGYLLMPWMTLLGGYIIHRLM